MRWLSALLAGGGLVAAGTALAFGARSAKTEATTKAAVASGGQIRLRLTTYWPFTAKAGERGMEGGVHDRKGRDLHTLEDFFAGKSDHVSLSGDDGAWPYGQKILIAWPDGRTVVGRVTDTGRNFRGSTKVMRVFGAEPADVCVYSKLTKVPEIVMGTIVKDDTLDVPGKRVVTSKFQGQSVEVGGLHMLGTVFEVPLARCVERGEAIADLADAVAKFKTVFPGLSVGIGEGCIAARARDARDFRGVPDEFGGIRVDKVVTGPVWMRLDEIEV